MRAGRKGAARSGHSLSASVLPEGQAIFFRRRNQATRPPKANTRPGRPAPTTGPGTEAPER